jgi:hypothetical protein
MLPLGNGKLLLVVGADNDSSHITRKQQTYKEFVKLDIFTVTYDLEKRNGISARTFVKLPG